MGGGLLAWLLTGQFPNAFDGVWWSFLRLTDPGYLGDDEGAVLRVQSTIITVPAAQPRATSTENARCHRLTPGVLKSG